MLNIQTSLKCCILLAFSILLCTSTVLGQVTGAIAGRAIDASGAALPGSQVVATNVSTNAVQQAWVG